MHVVEQRTARVGSTWLHHLYNVRAFLGYLPAYYKGGLDSFVIVSFFLQEETGNCCVCAYLHSTSVCVQSSVPFLYHQILVYFYLTSAPIVYSSQGGIAVHFCVKILWLTVQINEFLSKLCIFIYIYI